MKPATQPRIHVSRMLEDVVGCKWSMAVLGALRRGVYRPGAIERELSGITTKVLNERLRKLLAFGIAEREVFPERPPRVEYRLTSFGSRFAELLDLMEQLDAELPKQREGR